MPASARARSSSCPAGPTKGRPWRSSWSPGCSPTKASAAPTGPSPSTAWVLPSTSGGEAAMRRLSASRVGGSSGWSMAVSARVISPTRGPPPGSRARLRTVDSAVATFCYGPPGRGEGSMNHVADLGRRIELVPMDPHCHDITLALYETGGVAPAFRVHSYSMRSGAAERVAFVTEAMKVLGDMESVPGTSTLVRFRCGAEHKLAC